MYTQPNGEGVGKSSMNNDEKVGENEKIKEIVDNTATTNAEKKQIFKNFMLSDNPTNPINLNLDKSDIKATGIGVATGSALGFASGTKDVKKAKENVEQSTKVADKAQELCEGNMCPMGSNNPADYYTQANMQLGIGQTQPGYFDSTAFTTAQSHQENLDALKKAKNKRLGKTVGLGVLGGGAGYLINKLIKKKENPNAKFKLRIGGS